MKRKLLLVGLFLILVFTVTMVASASNKSANDAEVDSYIVVMELDPVVRYEGDVKGYQATKPGKGDKVNPNSAHVKKYQQFLEKSHDASLEAADASAEQKVHDYTVALNGYSAVLTEEQAKDVETQKAASSTAASGPSIPASPTMAAMGRHR